MGNDDTASSRETNTLRDRAEVADHFIPVLLQDLRPLLARRRGDDRDGEPARLIELLLRQATQSRVDRLKQLFSRCQPPQGLIKRGHAETTSTREADRALMSELEETLALANYRPLPREEIEAAFTSEAIFDVKVEVSLEDFDQLLIYVRGRHRKSETIRRWFGMKRREIQMTVFDRVFFLARRAKLEVERPTPPSVEPPPLVMKLFAGIPSADLEMLFPNSKVRMRPMDAAFIAIPAVAGLFGVAAKVLSSALALYAVLLYSLGWSEEPPPDGIGAAWAAVGAGFFALLAFCIGRYNSYKNKHLRFASSLTKTLYFRTLDSEAGAFLRVLEEATEEEIKEAVLGYEFLRDEPCDEQTLDERIEAWFRDELGVEMDFEVDDALGKLARLGIAECVDGVWRALPPTQAREVLLERWQALATA
jgi:hypothetical protein